MRNAARIVVLLVVIGGAAFWWFKPGYIVLDVPVVRHAGGGEFWWESQYSELAYADSWGVLYLHRRVGTAYPETHWRTLEEAFAFFDKAMAERGWTVRASGADDTILPKSRMIARENAKSYRRPDFRSRPDECVQLAIWPIPGGKVDGFHVVLVTVRPSFMKILNSALD